MIRRTLSSDSILGTVGTGEFSAIGFQQDTSIVADHIYTTGAATGNSFDTFYNVNDTVRDSHFVNNEAGMYLDGTGWVAYNDTILVAGRYNPGISVTQRGATQTSATNCVMDVNGGGQVVSSFTGTGAIVFENNTITGNYVNTNWDDFESSNITSTHNNFHGIGRFITGVYPSQTTYANLASFHAATGYENGSRPLVVFSSPVQQINFGQYKLGQFKDTTAAMTNEGGDTLKITAITSTNPVFSPRPTVRNIPFDSLFTDTIRFTPTSFGNFSGKILIASNDPLGPDTIAVTGTSPYPTLAVSQPSLNFGIVVRNSPKLQSVQITNSSINTLSVDSIYTRTSLFAVNKTKDSVSTSDSVVITFTPLVFGSFIDTLYLRNNSTSALIKVPLSGSSPTPTLGLNQSSLNFGNVARDSSKQLMLQISNSTVNLLTIDSIYTKTSVFKVSKTNISIPAIDSIAVVFSPVAVAGFTDTLYLRNNSASALVKVPLTGNCPSPLLISSQNGIFFPDRALQDWAVTTVYARNASTIPLSISNITTTNNAFTVSPKTAGISGFDSTTLRIVFKPALFGTVIDTMTVISDAGVVKVPLNGTSPYPVIGVNKSAINFGLVPASDSTYQQF